MLSDVSRDGGWAATYAEVPELYGGISPVSPELGNEGAIRILAGRKLEHWSHLDEQWSLGIWQPRFRWDYLHPETVGLTGAYLEIERPLIKIVAWGSPIFVPERGAQVTTDGGLFESGSRWFVPPPRTVRLFGVDTPVNYTLAMPAVSDLVAHPGASVMARVGQDEGVWGSVGFAYKPINQLLLADEGSERLASTPDGIYIPAIIHPRVEYHALTSIEAGYESERARAWVSALSEHPFRDETPAAWNTEEITPAFALSATADVRLAGSRSRETRGELSWLGEWGGNAGDRGPDAPGGEASQFEARYPYQTAVSAGVRTSAIERWEGATRLIYDIGHRGTIWSTEVAYRPWRRWALAAGVDLTTSFSGADDPTGADLIARFNANDRVHAGVSYVF
jgi:hypothetical protein